MLPSKTVLFFGSSAMELATEMELFARLGIDFLEESTSEAMLHTGCRSGDHSCAAIDNLMVGGPAGLPFSSAKFWLCAEERDETHL